MLNITKINKAIWRVITGMIYRPRFGGIGKKTIIFKPMQLDNTKSVYLKDYVFIAHNAWLMGNKGKKCTLTIESRTVIGHFAHIIANDKVIIGKSVLIADKVFITDCTHSYEDLKIPISEQPIMGLKEVYIGDESWLGENVCVLGASIGKHCIIGANSVVINDIPDYSVAAGNPAKVIKKYDFEQSKWVKA
ncbi:acyltransferase [Lacrimispora sp.]|jgi:serine acetyltransferase|uniref:acyltransferase n=1 Tax=Lacrimispora sp. TaxID=2719234 RepID=UPI0028AB4458|nr:acyltransferase [Lacrimispora sp.]